MNYQDQKFIIKNLDLPNNKLAAYLQLTEGQIRNYLHRNRIKRTPEEISNIKLRIGAEQSGVNNPNWKGGISKDHYHYKKIQVERHPEKINARQKVYYHKRAGNIIPGACEICNCKEGITAHHPDYSQPLNVVWLCSDCHKELHRKEREQGRKQSYKLIQLPLQLNLFNDANYNKQQTQINKTA